MTDAKKILTTMMMLGAMVAMVDGEFSKEPVDIDMMEQSEDEERKMMEEDECDLKMQ